MNEVTFKKVVRTGKSERDSVVSCRIIKGQSVLEVSAWPSNDNLMVSSLILHEEHCDLETSCDAYEVIKWRYRDDNERPIWVDSISIIKRLSVDWQRTVAIDAQYKQAVRHAVNWVREEQHKQIDKLRYG